MPGYVTDLKELGIATSTPKELGIATSTCETSTVNDQRPRGSEGGPPSRRATPPGERPRPFQFDLFDSLPSDRAVTALTARQWPLLRRFPTNRSREHVRDVVWGDLLASRSPILVAGYSSIGTLVELIAEWDDPSRRTSNMRLVLGAEPFASNRHSFQSDRKEFTDEARKFWLEEQGISLRLSAKVLQAIDVLTSGALHARFVHGTRRLHAKVYVGDHAATLGSSNFTEYGLALQLEANARFEVTKERQRYQEVVEIAENYWAAGEDWNDELLELLEGLLKVVTWQEALARACAELLTGAWAERYLTSPAAANRALWPSQREGIAEALWILENVGSVLVADATGSGKTRMGAHLVRAARDRLWRTGRVRQDVTVLVGPPAIIDTWEREALGIGVSITPVSHGRLSQVTRTGEAREELAVRGAQILAVDEAHNFLNAQSNRTQQVRLNLADNVMLFTATPISRGASDLLDLIGLLGPDNFEDETLEILNRLERRRGSVGVLSPDDIRVIRRGIQRFTVRRTKTQLNGLVDRDESAYVDSNTGRVCRYPLHKPRTYATGETPDDSAVADRIRPIAEALVGIAQLERQIAVPAGLQRMYSDADWLRFRVRSATGLARHHVLEALRSSRAAVAEHIAGTAIAAERYKIDARFKSADSGDVLTKLDKLASIGPPKLHLDCEVYPWLGDPALWAQACVEERARYQTIEQEVRLLSASREMTKASLLLERFSEHDAVLAFDHHPITLAVLESILLAQGLERDEVMVAAGNRTQKTRVIRRFAPDGTGRAIALCSDAMNEGLNLQRASCIVHLDLPTTLRVAEQRVGRVERMNSPHDIIESWWPDDGAAFATRAYEKLVRRARESEELLGSNLQLPEFEQGLDNVTIVSAAGQIAELEAAPAAPWDGIQDALDPVRRIVTGPDALVPPEIYAAYQDSSNRVMSRVSPVASARPWAFFSIAAIAQGAPRWMLIDGGETLTDLRVIADRLRDLLRDEPRNRPLDAAAVTQLNRFLDTATAEERNLLPLRMRRAVMQMSTVLRRWSAQANREGDGQRAGDWLALERLASSDAPPVDPYLIAERWLGLVTPSLERYREENRRARYVLLRDIEPQLITHPLPYEKVRDTFAGLPSAVPLEQRVSACIIGVPEH